MHTLLTESCYTCFHAPLEPGTPFGPGVWFFDILRVIVLVNAVAMLVLSALTIPRAKSLPQRVRIASTAVFVVFVAGTEVDRFGDYAHWRLAAALIATTLGAWGLIAFLLYELPSSPERMERHDERRRKRRLRRNGSEPGPGEGGPGSLR